MVIDAAITSYIEKLMTQKRLVLDALVCASIIRRVHPLQRRSHKICHISGPNDPTRFTTCILDSERICQQVRAITDSKIAADWEWGKTPLRRSKAAPSEVSFS